jgi:hypothetical protein
MVQCARIESFNLLFSNCKFGSCITRDLICANLDLQSVDNEIVLWEPKTKEQSPGEVTQF